MLTTEQKEARRKGIGGSDVASVLNLPPYGCSRKLFYDKTGVKPDFEDINPNMERGIRLEDIACNLYTEQTGKPVHTLKSVKSDAHPFMLANVDRIIAYGEKPEGEVDGDGVLEVKCPSNNSFTNMKRDGIPEAYILQGQHYMYVTEKDWMDYAIFCADLWQLEVVHIERDEDLIKMIIEAEEKFWKRVQDNDIPDRLEWGEKVCKGCNWRLACWKEEWTDDIDGVVYDTDYILTEDDDFLEAYEEHKENVVLGKQVDTLFEKSKKKLQGVIGDLSGDHKKIKFQCTLGKVSYAWETKTYVDNKKLKKENPDLVKKYEYEGGSKVMRFYPEKGKKWWRTA